MKGFFLFFYRLRIDASQGTHFLLALIPKKKMTYTDSRLYYGHSAVALSVCIATYLRKKIRMYGVFALRMFFIVSHPFLVLIVQGVILVVLLLISLLPWNYIAGVTIYTLIGGV